MNKFITLSALCLTSSVNAVLEPVNVNSSTSIQSTQTTDPSKPSVQVLAPKQETYTLDMFNITETVNTWLPKQTPEVQERYEEYCKQFMSKLVQGPTLEEREAISLTDVERYRQLRINVLEYAPRAIAEGAVKDEEELAKMVAKCEEELKIADRLEKSIRAEFTELRAERDAKAAQAAAE